MKDLILLLIFVTTLRSTIAGTICLSCSGVDNKDQCTHLETCRNDEICFIHKYLTESGAQQFDLGCTYPELCVNKKPAFALGKRLAEGHHMVCQGCCNSTNVCNLNTPCDIAVNHNTSFVDKRLPRECEDINSTISGVHTIYPDSYTPVSVFCVVTKDEKWTVIQKRLNGYVDFYRSWDAYKQGFGDPAGEYWLGNEAIHKISSSTGHKLSIYMEDFDAKFIYANYSNFLIGDEMENYQLTVTGFSGSPGAGNGLRGNNNKSFSTKDKDNDPYSSLNCAQYEHGAWWYVSCGNTNLNGPYVAGFNKNETSVFWLDWKNSFYSLKKVTMMIKRIRKID